MKRRTSSIIWGIFIVALGVILLGKSFNFWNLDIFFKGWWTLFIIIPSFAGLFEKDSIIGSFLGLTIGILLLLGSQNIINWDMIGKLFLAIVLIIIGFGCIFKPKISKISKKDNNDANEYIGVFSENSDKIKNNFDGATCVSIFGSVKLDLEDAIIKKDIVIECVSVFGGTHILAPENVNIKTSGVPIFGGVEKKEATSYNQNNPTIYINYVCIFGGIKIK